MRIPQIIVIALTAAALLTALAFLPVEQLLTWLQEWVLANEQFAFLVVAAFITAGFLLSLPASILMMLAGFLFGLGPGFACAWIAVLFASSLAFWVSRSAARRWFERKIRRKPLFMAIDRAIRRKGFLIVTLTRLVMVLPFPALNYMLGLTGVRFRDYLAGTLIGMIPPLFLFVFLGTTAGNIAAIVRGHIELEEGHLKIAVLAGIAVVVAIGFIIRMSSRVLKEELRTGTEAT